MPAIVAAADVVPAALLIRPFRDEVRYIERDLCALELDRYLRRLVRTEACCRRVLGTLAARFLDARAHQRLGFVRVSDYARERLGISERELQDVAKVAGALARLPALTEAFRRGEISWTQARILGAVATLETETQWLTLARGRTTRALEALVRAWNRGECEHPNGEHTEAPRIPVSRGSASAVTDALGQEDETIDGEPSMRFRLLCPRRLRARWRIVVELARRVAGEALAPWRVAEAIAAEGLSAAPTRHRFEGDETASEPADDPLAALRDHHEHESADPEETRAAFVELDWSALEDLTPEYVATLAEGVGDLDAHVLDIRLRAVLRTMQRLDWQTGRLLRLIVDLRLYALLGFSSSSRYVRERLGISTSKARMLIGLERATWSAPALADAYRDGAISWARALTIAPILRETTAAAWVARAGEVTVRRLAQEVEWALTLQDLTPLCDAVTPPPMDAPLKIPDAQMRAHTDEHESDDRHDCRARQGIDADITFRGPASVVTLFRQAIHAFAEPRDLPWQACERLFTHVEATWNAQPRHRDPIFARDGWRCAVPACSSRRHLHDHHLEFLSHGGSNARNNRIALCAGHHLHGIHARTHVRTVRASGRAPDAILWELGVREDGPPLLRLLGDRYLVEDRGGEETGAGHE